MKSKINRIQKLRQKLPQLEVDAILISQPEDRFYLSGFETSFGFLLITPQEAILATDFRYVEEAKQHAPDYNIFQITNGNKDWLPQLLNELNIKRLGFQSEALTFNTYQQLSDILKNMLPQSKFVPLDRPVESLRAIKEPDEIELITRAAEIGDRAMEYAGSIVYKGLTEKEVAWEIEKFMRETGSEQLPFTVIVASGPNSPFPHAKTSSRIIEIGEPVIIDIGARVSGYSSDLTRTFFEGNKSNTFAKIYGIVLEAQLASLDAIKTGMTGGEADGIGRKVIEQAGYGKDFGHAIGHGVGLAVHEFPRLGPNSTDILNDGMVFTVEPGIYLTGWGGVRIEDLVTLENGKIKVLSKSRK